MTKLIGGRFFVVTKVSTHVFDLGISDFILVKTFRFEMESKADIFHVLLGIIHLGKETFID